MQADFLQTQYAAHMAQQQQLAGVSELPPLQQRCLHTLLQCGARWFVELQCKDMYEFQLSDGTLHLGCDIYTFVVSRLALEANAVASAHPHLRNVWVLLSSCARCCHVQKYMVRSITHERAFSVQGLHVPRHVFYTDPAWIIVKPLHVLLWACLWLGVQLHGSKEEIRFFKETSIACEVDALCGCMSPELRKEVAENKHVVLFFTGICTVRGYPFPLDSTRFAIDLRDGPILALHATQEWHDFGYYRSKTFVLMMCLERVFEVEEPQADNDALHMLSAEGLDAGSLWSPLAELSKAVSDVCIMFQGADCVRMLPMFKMCLMHLGVQYALGVICEYDVAPGVNDVLRALKMRLVNTYCLYLNIYPDMDQLDFHSARQVASTFLRALIE